MKLIHSSFTVHFEYILDRNMRQFFSDAVVMMSPLAFLKSNATELYHATIPTQIKDDGTSIELTTGKMANPDLVLLGNEH